MKIIEPADQSVFGTSPVTIRGQSLPDAVVSINGDIVTVDASGNFAWQVTLDEGANTYDIIATNDAGDEADDSITLFYSP